MRRSFYISVLIVLYLLLTGKSCDNREETARALELAELTAAKDSIRAAIAPDTLTGSSLQAFERVAVTRLSDFSDYLAILRDTAVDPAFKEKARDMIRKMFIPGHDSASFFGRILPDSTRVVQPLQRTGGPDYHGVLSFTFNPAAAWSGSSTGRSLVRGTVGFTVTRNPKVFGADTLMVWEVLLGSRE